MEIEYIRFNCYDGLKALIDEKHAKRNFSKSREFVGGTESEAGS